MRTIDTEIARLRRAIECDRATNQLRHGLRQIAHGEPAAARATLNQLEASTDMGAIAAAQILRDAIARRQSVSRKAA